MLSLKLTTHLVRHFQLYIISRTYHNSDSLRWSWVGGYGWNWTTVVERGEEHGGITLIKRSTVQQQTNKVATKRSNKRPLALSPADKLLSFVYFSDQADVCSNATVVLFDRAFAWSYVYACVYGWWKQHNNTKDHQYLLYWTNQQINTRTDGLW